MQIIRGLKGIRSKHKKGALTIGKFDGIHLGHQQLFAQVKKYATMHNIPSIVMIFEPSPNEFFNPNHMQARLSTLREKLFYLSQAQIDYILIIPFNLSLSQLSASHFIEEILIKQLAIKKLWVGDDFKFGFQRQGDYTLLKKYTPQSFSLSKIEPYFLAKTRVSSSLIRQAIHEKSFTYATELLGHDFSISGYIVEGQKLGRTIGYPTANLGITTKHHNILALLTFGVYLVRLHVYKEQEKVHTFYGVANYGIKPTVMQEKKLSFETYCFDLSTSIYHQLARIEILDFIRSEQQFSSLTQLTEQISKDVEWAKREVKREVKREYQKN